MRRVLPKLQPGGCISNCQRSGPSASPRTSSSSTVQFMAGGDADCGTGGAAAVCRHRCHRGCPTESRLATTCGTGQKTINYITKICSNCDCARVKEERKSKTGFIILRPNTQENEPRSLRRNCEGETCTENNFLYFKSL